MSTKYIASNWRLLNQKNSNKNDNYGLSFDANEYISCDVITQLGNKTEATWSGWFNRGGSGSYYIMGSWGTTGTERQFLVLQTPTALTVFMGLGQYGNQRTMFQNTSLTFTTGEWYHLMFVYDESEADNADKMKVYINGSLQTNQSTGAAINFINPVTSPFLIGTIGGYLTNKFVGQISQVSIFDYALSSLQRSTLYGSSSLGAGNPMALKPAPVAFYNLGDNTSGGLLPNPSPPPTNISILTQPNEAVEDASVFDFDGSSSQFINNGYFNELDSSDLSFSIWLKKTNTDYAQVVDSQTAGNSGILIAINSSDQVFVRVNTLTASTTTSGFANIGFQRDKWQNIILTYNNITRNLIVYLNNQSVSNTTGSLTTKGASLELKIGGVSGSYFTGQISNAQIWNTELSSSEVTTLYNSGVPLLTGTQPQASNLKAWYKLDQSANWEADSSGNWQIPDAVSAYPQSFDFDGSDDYISASIDGTGGSSSIINGDLTLSFWFLQNTVINNKGLIQWANALNSTTAFLSIRVLNTSNGTLRFQVGDLTSRLDYTYSQNDLWQNVVITRTSSDNTWRFYVNGNLEGSYNDSGALLNQANAQTLYLGNGYNGFLNGKMSNLMLFNTALPATGTDSVETLYNNGTPLTTAIAIDNLKAWYKLDNTATWTGSAFSIPDASGNGNTGTSSGMTEQNLVNNNVSTLNGESSGMTSASLVLSDLSKSIPYDSYSFNFDSVSSDYIELPKDSTQSFVNTDFSISIWLNPDISHNALVFMNYASNNGWGVYYNSGNLRFRAYPSAWQTLTTINTNEWTHILIVGDDTGNNLLCYKNGVEVYNSSYTLSIVESTDNVYIGSQNGSAFFFDGKISNVSFFNQALTSTEVLKLYANGVPQDLTNFTPQPVAWYPLGSNSFWNGSQWIVRDMSTGGSNDGTGQNIGVDGLVGDAPRSEANGTGTNMDIPTNLEGSTKWSSNNSWSINMSSTARVEDTP